MTNEQILKLAETCGFKELTDENSEIDDEYWGCWEQQLLNFALAIRKETIEEIFTSLKDVPNPEANRTAINRIMSMNND
jgi:predicted mannosyl-3-phosphoglycerate phosphatase (HAD superfamily)